MNPIQQKNINKPPAQNGQVQNGQTDDLTRQSSAPPAEAPKDNQGFNFGFLSPSLNSDQAVILRQSPSWSRGVVWSIIGVTVIVVGWAYFAKIEQVVQAQGQLKPQGTVKEIQPPVNGLVKEVLVEDGEKVEAGEVLIRLDPRATQAELVSLQAVRQSLERENAFYETLMNQSLNPTEVEQAIIQLKLPWEVAALARSRVALISENQLLQIQLDGRSNETNLSADQLARLQAGQLELSSRATAARLEMEQLQKQFNQTQVQLADAKAQHRDDQRVLAELKARNTEATTEAQKSLAIEQEVLSSLEPLLEEGALSRLQVEQQKREIIDRYQRMVESRANGLVESQRQQQQVQERQAEIQRLQEEQKRLELAIAQAQARLTNTVVVTEKEVRDQMSSNKQRVADIDSQLTKIVVDNKNRLAELKSQIERSKVTLEYQEIKSPVGGTVFDLKAFAGYVPPPSQSEPLLKIVPDDKLVAEVDITNQDIGFVAVGDPVDVRIDSFPFSEFGDIKGEVISIGSDALPPNETQRFYRFPVKVKLDQQELKVRDRAEPLDLQSGMSITANIKVKENRTVLSLFTELFTKKVETLKKVR